MFISIWNITSDDTIIQSVFHKRGIYNLILGKEHFDICQFINSYFQQDSSNLSGALEKKSANLVWIQLSTIKGATHVLTHLFSSKIFRPVIFIQGYCIICNDFVVIIMAVMSQHLLTNSYSYVEANEIKICTNPPLLFLVIYHQ